MQAKQATKEIAKLYLNSDTDALLPKHSLPILGDWAKYSRGGGLLKRYRTEDVSLPFFFVSMKFKTSIGSGKLNKIEVITFLFLFQISIFRHLECYFRTILRDMKN